MRAPKLLNRGLHEHGPRARLGVLTRSVADEVGDLLIEAYEASSDVVNNGQRMERLLFIIEMGLAQQDTFDGSGFQMDPQETRTFASACKAAMKAIKARRDFTPELNARRVRALYRACAGALGGLALHEVDPTVAL
jgi:hypothetical protein